MTGLGPMITELDVAVPHLLEINTSLPGNHPGDLPFAVTQERHLPAGEQVHRAVPPPKLPELQ